MIPREDQELRDYYKNQRTTTEPQPTTNNSQIAAVVPGEHGRPDAVIYDIPPEQRITNAGPVNTISVVDPMGNRDAQGNIIPESAYAHSTIKPSDSIVPDPAEVSTKVLSGGIPSNIDPQKTRYGAAGDIIVDAQGHVYGWNDRASDYNRPLDADPSTVSGIKNQYGSASLFNYTRAMYGSPSDPLGWNTFAAKMNEQYGAGTYGYLAYSTVKPYEFDQMFGARSPGRASTVSVLEQARSQTVPGGLPASGPYNEQIANTRPVMPNLMGYDSPIATAPAYTQPGQTAQAKGPGGSGLVFLSAAPLASSMLTRYPAEYLPVSGVSASDAVRYGSSAGMSGVAAGSIAQGAAGAIVNAPTYRSDPTDTTGFKDPLHMQGLYNMFAGGVSAVTSVADNVAGGVSKWYSDYHHKLNTGGLSLFGGEVSANNPRLAGPAGGNIVSDSVEQYSPGVANFGAKTLIYMNPIAGGIMAAGTVGMAYTGLGLAAEGSADAGLRTGQAIAHEYKNSGDIINSGAVGISTAANTTFVKSAGYHITGADIYYDKREIAEINHGTSMAQTHHITYEESVYHIPGLGERAMGVISDPGAIVGGMAGGMALSGLLRGASVGARVGTGGAGLVDDVAGVRGGWYDSAKAGQYGGKAYTGLNGPENAMSMNRPNIRGYNARGVPAGAGVADTMNIHVNRGGYGGIGSTVIKVGDQVVGGTRIIGGAGYASEIPAGGYGVSDEVIVKNYDVVNHEINAPTVEDNGIINSPANNNVNGHGYADAFRDRYGFNPGNAYNQGQGYGYSEINDNAFKTPEENAFVFDHPGMTDYGHKYGYDTLTGRARAGTGPMWMPNLDMGGFGRGGRSSKFGKAYIREVKNPFGLTIVKKKISKRSKLGGKKR